MYPYTPGYQKHSFTSIEAAESFNPSRLHSKILNLLENRIDGITIDEVAAFLSLETGTASARVGELEKQGKIFKSDNARKTRKGRNARIYYKIHN